MPPFRLICILILGFSSGLPLALTGSTLQAWLAVENVDIKTIGLYAVVGFPYTYKFLWSPFLDYLKPGFFDQRRGWIALMQLACAGLIAAMAFVDAHSAWTVAAVAVAIAFCSSTQDMAIDAYRTDLLPAPERGLGAAYYVTGYRVAMLVSGGLALILAGEYLGWTGTYLLMAGLIAACAVITALSPSADTPEDLARRASKRKLFDIVRESTGNFMSGDLDFAVDCALQGGRCVCGFIDHCISAQGIGFYIDRSGCREQDGEPDRHTVGRISGGRIDDTDGSLWLADVVWNISGGFKFVILGVVAHRTEYLGHGQCRIC
jgi:MFS transporter, PAT family, beta-lactamase induction signal transducer AmpG